MGVFDWLFSARPLAADVLEPVVGRTFAIDRDSIDPALMGFASYSDPIAPAGRITRASARQIPAIKRARDIICGTLGTIPLQVIDTENVAAISPLLDQPEDNVCAVNFTDEALRGPAVRRRGLVEGHCHELPRISDEGSPGRPRRGLDQQGQGLHRRPGRPPQS